MSGYGTTSSTWGSRCSLRISYHDGKFATGEKADWLDHKSFFSQFIRGKVSPRLAIGYPISERTVFYFNYAHFLQYPDRDQYYHDPISDKIISGNYVGKPVVGTHENGAVRSGIRPVVA